MSPYKANGRNFITAAVLISLLTTIAQTALTGTSLLGVLLAPATVVSAVTGSWFLFDRWLWKKPIARVLGLSYIPNLNGLWYGDVDRIGEQAPHSFELKVTQTYSRISMTTKTDNSHGYSIKSFYLCDENLSSFELINYWYCKTKSKGNSGFEEFHGLSRIRLIDERGLLILEDEYFTDRNPPTQGRVNLRRRYVA